MGVSLTTFRADTNRYLKHADVINFTQADRDEIIKDAVRKYSQERPLNIVYPITATTDNWYTLPSDYEQGFSIIFEIEYPVEQTPKRLIRSKYWEVQQMYISSATAWRLRFDLSAPSSGDTFWIKYTKRHSFDESGDSEIPVAHENAVAYLATSLMCQALADFFGGKSDANLPNVDFVEQPDRVSEWENLAGTWLKKFKAEMTQEVNGIHGQINFSQDMYFEREYE